MIKTHNNIKLYICLVKNIISNLYYNNTFINIYYFIIIPLFLVSNLYFTCDVLLCDDGSLPYEAYNWSYESRGIDRPVEYQPYRPGLQETSEGYRYELPAESSNPPQLIVNFNGKLVYAQYLGYDSAGNPMYTYKNHSFSIDSTRLGEIEPTRSEVINTTYYQGGGLRHKDVITTKFNSKPGFWNKIKSDFKNARDSASKDRELSLKRESTIIRAVRASRARSDMDHLSRRNQVSSYYNNQHKVRRFD